MDQEEEEEEEEEEENLGKERQKETKHTMSVLDSTVNTHIDIVPLARSAAGKGETESTTIITSYYHQYNLPQLWYHQYYQYSMDQHQHSEL
ncbi:unnamed protein product [Lota lota]